jgi:hypothetical protein
MASQQPNCTDATRIAKAVEQLVKETPAEVIQRMNERLQRRRKSPAATASDELLHKRAG